MQDSNTIFLIDQEEYSAHPLFNKQVVFTGALSRMTRTEAAKRARACGAVIQGAVTKETDFVFVGKQRHHKSTKQRKAELLISQGIDIQIIEEEDLYWILSFDER
jgi:NAD-dependent DNA ligase